MYFICFSFYHKILSQVVCVNVKAMNHLISIIVLPLTKFTETRKKNCINRIARTVPFRSFNEIVTMKTTTNGEGSWWGHLFNVMTSVLMSFFSVIISCFNTSHGVFLSNKQSFCVVGFFLSFSSVFVMHSNISCA